jgi:antitoxin component YwqK of YwqJK toxin-antitoxin module
MARILKEEKYPNGSFKSRETELHGQPGKQVILKEGWYPAEADPLNPWQATNAAQQRSGRQEYKQNYVNGQFHGVQESWYENGQHVNKENYANGKKHGLQERWYPDGQQRYKGNYVNGQRHGVQEYWYRDGQQEYKVDYVNGQYHGVQERWYPCWYPFGADPKDPRQATDAAQRRGGQQAYKWNYVNGQEHGIQEAWDENGQHKYRKYHLDGNEVSQQTYQSYVGGLAPEVQATIDFEEPNLSKVIAMYLLP